MKRTTIQHVENHAAFSERIAAVFPTLDPRYTAIEHAYRVSKDAFRGTLREGGERYFEHLRQVALIILDHLRIRDHRLISAGLLHDIVEDIPSWPLHRVVSEFGRDVASIVEWVTKPPLPLFFSKAERDHVYHTRLLDAPREVAIVKLSDRLHNVRTLWDCSPDKRLRKIEETRRWYLPLAEKHIILIHELEAALAELETTDT